MHRVENIVLLQCECPVCIYCVLLLAWKLCWAVARELEVKPHKHLGATKPRGVFLNYEPCSIQFSLLPCSSHTLLSPWHMQTMKSADIGTCVCLPLSYMKRNSCSAIDMLCHV